MLSDRELLEIQVETLFRLDAKGRLASVNEPLQRPVPRVFAGRTLAGEMLVRARFDLPDDLARALEGCSTQRQLLEVLGDNVASGHHGPAYAFSRVVTAPTGVVRVTGTMPLHQSLLSWEPDVRAGLRLFGIVRDGHVVAVCYSSRNGERACEAGTETAPEWRGQGLARLSVTGWAAAVQASGRLALYSTAHDNVASQAVARALGLHQYAEDWSFD